MGTLQNKWEFFHSITKTSITRRTVPVQKHLQEFLTLGQIHLRGRSRRASIVRTRSRAYPTGTSSAACGKRRSIPRWPNNGSNRVKVLLRFVHHARFGLSVGETWSLSISGTVGCLGGPCGVSSGASGWEGVCCSVWTLFCAPFLAVPPHPELGPEHDIIMANDANVSEPEIAYCAQRD